MFYFKTLHPGAQPSKHWSVFHDKACQLGGDRGKWKSAANSDQTAWFIQVRDASGESEFDPLCVTLQVKTVTLENNEKRYELWLTNHVECPVVVTTFAENVHEITCEIDGYQTTIPGATQAEVINRVQQGQQMNITKAHMIRLGSTEAKCAYELQRPPRICGPRQW